jgi:DNA-nicking Smr family endonuclease
MWCWSMTIRRPRSRRSDVAGRRARALTETDRQEWAAFTRQILPLDGREVPQAPRTLVEATPQPVAPAPAKTIRPPPSLSVGEHPGGLDNASWNRFRSGKLSPSRTLDLHGRTAQRAFHALQAFLHAAHADQVRCVEVITGRGSGEGGGVLRRELPLWLNLPQLRPLVLAASHPHAANSGSVRLLLRRVRA